MLLFVISDEKKKSDRGLIFLQFFRLSCHWNVYFYLWCTWETLLPMVSFSYLWCYCLWCNLVTKSKSSCQWCTLAFGAVTLSNAGGKTHKQALLGLLHAGKGSIWWGQFRGLGWKNGWPEYVLCYHARQFQCIISTTSCDLMPYFSIIFTYKNWSDIWNKLKQNKNAIECNVFFVLSFLKGVDIWVEKK